MRAGKVDLLVETGAKLQQSFELWSPDTPAPFGSVVAGQRVFLEGFPQPVFQAVTRMDTDGITKTDLWFGHGLWYDPHVRQPSDAMLVPAKKDPILDASASFVAPLTGIPPEVLPPDLPADATEFRYDLTVTFSDGLIQLVVTEQETLDLGWLSNCSPFMWDLYAQTDRLGWSRLIEGTFMVTRGATRNESDN